MSLVISLSLINTSQKSYWNGNSKKGPELGNLSSASVFFKDFLFLEKIVKEI